ncbi:fumarylacetoacetate hydrolase, partial [Halorubrum ezzemoulense]
MKYLARTATGEPLLGDEEGYVPLGAVEPDLETVGDALPRAAAGDLGDVADATANPVPAGDVSFGAPLESFGKLWGIGLNYEEHAGDLDEQRPDEPASFMKPRSVLTGPGGPIRLPPESQSERVTAEAELAVVMGRTCRNVDEGDVD